MKTWFLLSCNRRLRHVVAPIIICMSDAAVRSDDRHYMIESPKRCMTDNAGMPNCNSRRVYPEPREHTYRAVRLKLPERGGHDISAMFVTTSIR
jgi:hypothetical protein